MLQMLHIGWEQHSAVSCSAPWPLLGLFCVSHHLLQIEASLIRVERCIYEYNYKSLEVKITLCPSSRVIIGGETTTIILLNFPFVFIGQCNQFMLPIG